MTNRWFGLLLVLAPLVCLAPTSAVRAQASCDNALQQAQQLFDRQQVIQTIRLLQRCEGVLEGAQRQVAMRLIALSYFEGDDRDSTRFWVRKLVREEGYRADKLKDPLYIQSLVRDFTPKWHQKRWVRITALGGIAVLGGVLGYVLRGGPDPLPGPPPGFPPPPGN